MTKNYYAPLEVDDDDDVADVEVVDDDDVDDEVDDNDVSYYDIVTKLLDVHTRLLKINAKKYSQRLFINELRDAHIEFTNAKNSGSVTKDMQTKYNDTVEKFMDLDSI